MADDGVWRNPIIPRTARTTDALLRALATSIPGQPAAREREKFLAFADLQAVTAAMASAMIGRGIRRGGVVALDLPVGIDFLLALLAVTRMGAVALPFHGLLRAEEVRALVDLAGPVLCLGRAFHRLGIPAVEPHDLAAEGRGEIPFAPPAEEDPAILRTTSGTTGRPKLIAVPHGQLCRRLPHPGLHYVAGDIYGCPHPHAFPSYQVLAALGAGGAVVFRPAATAAQVERFIAEEGVTWFWGVPALYEQVARAPGRPGCELASLRAAVTSAAYLSPASQAAVARRWGIPLYQSYALSELGFLTEADRYTPQGSVGRPAPGVELRVVGEAGEPAGTGMPGRIQARTDVPFGGYFTGEPSPVDGEGWFTTTDLGYLDEAGNLYIIGRRSDLINVGGFKVDVHEVAGVIAVLPGVREAHVFGRPHRIRGEAVAAAVVAEAGITSREVRLHCRSRLPRHKQPVEVFILPELPRTPLGKVDGRRLEEMIEDRGGADPGIKG